MKKALLLAVFLLFANGFSSHDAFAEQKNYTEQSRKFVDDLGKRIIGIAADKKISEATRKTKIINEVDKVIDSDWLARFVLGKNYKNASDQQKSRFLTLYRQFMINTYGPKFKNYNGREFNVLSVNEQNGFYIAKCEFIPHDSDKSISVDFRVKEREGKLFVLDFVAEGVSLIETQRSEFNSTISQKGMDKFMDDLQVRVEELKK